jgi:hypothetical protein
MSIYITNKTIKRGLKKFFEEEGKQIPKLINKSIAFILALLISLITSNFLLKTVMVGLNATQFGINDPIFNTDISFFLFQKPFIEMIIYYCIILVIGLTIYTAIYHIVAFNMFFDSIDGKMLRKSIFIKQLLVNAMLIVIGISALIVVKNQGIVNNQFLTLQDEEETIISGAGLTEKIIIVWGYRILAIVMVIAVFIAIREFKKQNTKRIIISLLSVPVYLIAMFIVMIGYQYLYVKQNELDKQKEFISKNIEFTKTAYNINIDEVDIDDNETITQEILDKNQDVVENIPVVNEDIVQTTIEDTQSNTGYYIYNSVSPIIYQNQLSYISAREISNESRTYNNKTYEYTHGYGAIITSASKTDSTGNLVYLLKEFATDNSIIKQPRIYYGTETKSIAVINNKSSEFDYPISSTQNAENKYEGNGGLQEDLLDRFILGISNGNLKLTFVDDESKILLNRNVRERAEKIMPYLMYDDNPYLTISDEGELIWVLDAYTTSNAYPYSQTSVIENEDTKQALNYIRNSVKVLINAYTGEINFYITDRTDPIAMAYNNMYPTLFKDSSEIPECISEQFIYSEFLYNIQAEILKMYHNVSTDVLYRGDDIWDSAVYSTSTTVVGRETMQPYYTMVKTVDSKNTELGLVLPYTLYDKQSIISYLVGTTNGVENKLTIYKFSQDANILGPIQLNNLLGQDEAISSEINTLSVTGTKLIKDTIIVPIDNSLLYVVPIYQLSLNEKESTPILKKVVVASGTKVAIGDNLESAIENLLSEQNAVEIEVENTDTVDELISSIIKANNNLYDSSSITDWEQMGKDITKLQDLIKQLEALKEEEQKEAKKNGETKTTEKTETSENENIIIEEAQEITSNIDK